MSHYLENKNKTQKQKQPFGLIICSFTHQVIVQFGWWWQCIARYSSRWVERIVSGQATDHRFTLFESTGPSEFRVSQCVCCTLLESESSKYWVSTWLMCCTLLESLVDWVVSEQVTNQCTVRYSSRCVAWAWDWVVWVAIVQVTGQCIIVRYWVEWPSHQSDWMSVEGTNFSNKGNTNTELPPQSFNNNQQFNTWGFGCITFTQGIPPFFTFNR